MTPEQFLELARVLPEPMCLVSGQGQIEALNPALAQLLTLTDAQVRGRDLTELVTEAPAKVRQYLRACASSRSLVLGALTWRTGTDQELKCRCEGAVIVPRRPTRPALLLLRIQMKESASRRFLLLNEKIEALAREIRERRRAEEAAHAERERFRVTLTSIGDAVIATDAAGRVEFINPIAETLTGWPLAESLGRPLAQVFQIINEYTREPALNPVSQVLREGVIVGLANHTILVARDGTERPIDDSGAPIRSEAGQIIGVVLVFRDVTARRSAEQEREELLAREREARTQAEIASRIKDEFLATVSHELRTPLNAILGWAGILRSRPTDPATIGRALEVIERNSKAQAQIIYDILDVSQITRGKLRLELRPLQLNSVIAAAVDTIRPTAAAKGLTVHLNLAETTNLIYGDEDRLQQIAWNLLSNAVKFTPSGGLIQVTLTNLPAGVELAIRDTGIGIKPDFLPYVFDRFRQGDSSITRAFGGLGLGLALVRHLVEMQGGTVQAESAGEGQGATFTVRFPQASLSPDQSAAPNPAEPSLIPPQADQPNLGGLRILVVDNELEARDMVQLALSQSGVEVRPAASSQEALEVLQQWQPDLLIAELGLPDQNGFELLSQVRELPAEQGGRIPAIALTTYSRADDRQRALAAGFHAYLVKPAAPAELRAAITRLIGRGAPAPD